MWDGHSWPSTRVLQANFYIERLRLRCCFELRCRRPRVAVPHECPKCCRRAIVGDRSAIESSKSTKIDDMNGRLERSRLLNS